MASTLAFTQFVCDQIGGAGNISYKKMFGEYGLYCDGKFFALICDDQLFIKITDAGLALFPHCETAPPYEGAKPYFLITELDDRDFLSVLIRNTCAELPFPKSKKSVADF